MRRNSQSCLALYVPLAKIHILLRARVDNLDVNALEVAWGDIRGDDDELVVVHRVPDTFRRRMPQRLKLEFDSVCGLGELENENEAGEEMEDVSRR